MLHRELQPWAVLVWMQQSHASHASWTYSHVLGTSNRLETRSWIVLIAPVAGALSRTSAGWKKRGWIKNFHKSQLSATSYFLVYWGARIPKYKLHPGGKEQDIGCCITCRIESQKQCWEIIKTGRGGMYHHHTVTHDGTIIYTQRPEYPQTLVIAGQSLS